MFSFCSALFSLSSFVCRWFGSPTNGELIYVVRYFSWEWNHICFQFDAKKERCRWKKTWKISSAIKLYLILFNRSCTHFSVLILHVISIRFQINASSGCVLDLKSEWRTSILTVLKPHKFRCTSCSGRYLFSKVGEIPYNFRDRSRDCHRSVCSAKEIVTVSAVGRKLCFYCCCSIWLDSMIVNIISINIVFDLILLSSFLFLHFQPKKFIDTYCRMKTSTFDCF